MDNSESRLLDVFFYGLYMDPEILRSKNVEPRNPRVGYVSGYKLKVGKMATLLRANYRAYGIVYSLTHNELGLLYEKSGLDMYVSESLLVSLKSEKQIPVVTKILLTPPEKNETNEEYKAKLLKCMETLKVPTSNA